MNPVQKIDWLERSTSKEFPYEVNAMQWERLPVRNPSINARFYSGDFLCGVVQQGIVGINVGYLFDGVTGFLDLPSLMRKAVFHDLGCQFQCNSTFRHLIADRAMVDTWFLEVDEEKARCLSKVCYAVVSAYGKLNKPVQHTGLSVELTL